MEDKQYRLIDYLFRNREDFVTSKDLSVLLDASARSVLRYISLINKESKQYGFEINSYYSKGYKLMIVDESKFLSYYLNIKEFNDFQKYIILSSLEHNEITYDELERKFFISRSSIMREIENLNSYTSSVYNVKVYYSNNILKFSGSEISIRSLVVDTIPDVEKIDMIFKLHNVKLFKDILFRLKKFYERENISISKLEVNNQCKYLFVSVLRMKNKNLIFEMDVLNLIALKNEAIYMNFINQTTNEIEDSTNIQITVNEKKYWLIVLLAQGIPLLDVKPSSIQSMTKSVIIILEEIGSKFGFKLKDDGNLVDFLVYHVITSLSGYILNKNDFHGYNVEIENIKELNRLAYFFSVEFCNRFNDKFDILIPESEVNYITLHFASSMQRNFDTKILSLGLCINRPKGYLEFIRSTLNSELSHGKILEVAGTCSELVKYKEISDFDCILIENNGELISLENIDIIEIPTDVSEKDIEFIDSQLATIKARKNLSSFMSEETYFNVSNIDNRFELISYIGEKLIAKNYLDSVELENIIDREYQSSTVIAENIAMPHTVVKGESFISITNLTHPIVWKNNIIKIMVIVGLKSNNLKNREIVESLLRQCKNLQMENLEKDMNFIEFKELLFS